MDYNQMLQKFDVLMQVIDLHIGQMDESQPE